MFAILCAIFAKIYFYYSPKNITNYRTVAHKLGPFMIGGDPLSILQDIMLHPAPGRTIPLEVGKMGVLEYHMIETILNFLRHKIIMLKKYIYIILAVFLHVCFVYIFLSLFPPYTTMTHLTEADKEWAKPYSVDECIVFKSNQNNYDTLIITYKNCIDNYFPLSCFMHYDAKNSFAHIEIQGKLVHNHARAEFQYDLIKYDSIGPITHSLLFDSRCSDGIYRNGSHTLPYVTENRLITDLNSATIYPQRLESKTTEIQLDKNRGILYYEFENGERFTFYKRIPRKITWKERIEEFLLLY